MIVIRFGKWRHKATSMFIYDRVFRNGYEWTPLCIKKFRYIDNDIDAITKAHEDIGYEQGYRDGCAEAEPKHGRWLDVEPAPFGQVYETCSECGVRQTLDKGNDKFCGVCGARMDEVEE